MRSQYYTTQEVKALTGLSLATLRNYVYFSRQTQAMLDGQQPPLGFPKVMTVRNRLYWDKRSTDQWVAQRIVHV